MTISEIKSKIKDKDLSDQTKELYLNNLTRIKDKVQEIGLFSQELFNIDNSYFHEYCLDLINYALTLTKPTTMNVNYSRALMFKADYLLYDNKFNDALHFYDESIKFYKHNNYAAIRKLYVILARDNFKYSNELELAFEKYNDIDDELDVLSIGNVNDRLTYFISQYLINDNSNTIDKEIELNIFNLQKGLLPGEYLIFRKKHNMGNAGVIDERLKSFNVDKVNNCSVWMLKWVNDIPG